MTTHPPLWVFIFHTNTNAKPPQPHLFTPDQLYMGTTRMKSHANNDLELKHTNPRPKSAEPNPQPKPAKSTPAESMPPYENPPYKNSPYENPPYEHCLLDQTPTCERLPNQNPPNPDRQTEARRTKNPHTHCRDIT
ncbi:hypothetical protein BS47DRAFT_1369394 [Hydnum rufescens UP504]|uniref:Uncharacterized protein n=1 Tax=Hydnum rufescens UP504 TaxID=1448309 RepID=A0A9P6AEW0_9AGAM|nr:hypothetical protein BS47DRAFT_1369394 [Hydnum rufescens UP504]